jgi:glycosyltransferase involved in cell wall biosynthesis
MNTAVLTHHRRNVLLLSTCVSIGGAERAVLCLARGLAARGVPVRTVFPLSADRPEMHAWFRDEGVAVETNPSLVALDEPHRLHDIKALARLVRESRAETVNIHFGGEHMSFKDVMAIRLIGGKRCVVTAHHAVPIGTRQKRLLTGLAGRLSDTVTVSTVVMRDLLTGVGVPARKIKIIPFGVEAPPTRPGRDEARARLRLPADAFVVSSLCRLMPHKGVADLIEAMARVPDPDGALRLVVGGDGPLRAELEAHAARRLGERAAFLGRLPATADLYAAADVFALPSYEEGFGLVYIEAALHGVPAIGTTVGGVPEAILDGETGLLVPPGAPDALAGALARLRDDAALRRRLGAAAQARANAEFTETVMAARFEKLLLP